MSKFKDQERAPVRYIPPEVDLVSEHILWCDKKRPIFGLPLSFTKYILYADRLVVQRGFLTRRTEEIRLYRILDASLKQSLGQRLFQLGSIRLQSADASSPRMFIHDVRHSENVHRMISDLAEQQRQLNRISLWECFGGFDHN